MDERLYINQMVSPSWEQVRHEGLRRADGLEAVKQDTRALLSCIRRYYLEDGICADANAPNSEALDALRTKLDRLEADIALLSKIHLFDEVSCRVELGVPQPRNRADPLADAEFVLRVERTALICFLYEILGAHVSNETDLQEALKRCVGHPVCVARRFLMRAASALRVHTTGEKENGNLSPGDDSFDEESSSAVHWWGASGSPRLALIGTHDTTILPLLVLFGMLDFRWPTFGASFVIELHRLEDGSPDSLFVRLLYCWPRAQSSSSTSDDPNAGIQIECIAERCLFLNDFLRVIEFFNDSESFVQ